MKHFSEADLLETYYMQPSEASAIIEHVNGCNACQDRYRRLAQKLRDTAACPTEKPDTFWTRQRLMIMRAVDNARAQSQRNARTARVIVAPVQVAATDDLKVSQDPWQSDELKDFGSVVQWESWVDQTNPQGSSL